MEIVVSNKLHLIGWADEHKKSIKDGCAIPNPMFWKMKKMGKPFVHLSEYIKYYEEDKRNGVLAIGRGCGPRLRGFMENHGLTATVHDITSYPHADFPKSTIELRPYQLGIPEAIIEHRTGVCRFDTGFGKTILALKAAELLQTPTLIIVPRTSIYEQFKKDIERFLGFRPSVLTPRQQRVSSLEDAGGPITLVTVQALQRRLADGDEAHWREFSRQFGCVIVDECHTTVPKKSRDVIESFHARYRYGFTATARRTDGQGDALSFIYGPIIADGKVERETPSIKVIEYRDQIPVDEYHEIINEHIEDEERNALIVKAAQAECAAGRKVLVLTKRVEHYETLAQKLDELLEGDGVRALASTGSPRERAQVLSSLRSAEGAATYQCLLGTFSLLSTGVDIPSLDTLIIAGDLKSDVLAEQSAGRILRLFDGKKKPKIIDVHDIGNPILKNQGRERRRFYASQGWDIQPYV